LDNAGIVLFKLAFAFCALGTVGFLLSLLVKRIALAKISTWILVITFAFLTLNLFLVLINPAGLLSIGSRDFFTFCAWTVSGAYLIFQLKTKTRLLGAFISPFILLFLIIAAGQTIGKSLIPQGMQNWLTMAHLALTIFGEALFILASCAGAMFIIQNSRLKHKKLTSLGRLLPALNDLDRINHFCLLWGFPLLTLGLLAGALLAPLAWQKGWPADPKIIWTCAIWITYGILLHQRLAIGWKGFRMATISCLVFVLFALSYLVVRFCFSTLHNFI
jgi:ABC-type transport system involved in cytochrome c biogenesis permease subunit